MPVSFSSGDHSYTSHLGERYIPVTALIARYIPPYDAHYWSTYKAIKSILTSVGKWEGYKKKAGGWKNVVTYCRKIDKEFPYKSEVLKEKKRILGVWKESRQEAADEGTFLHKLKETQTRGATGKRSVVGSRGGLIASGDFSSTQVFPEEILYNDKYRVAGQADLIEQCRNIVNITDYKTCKKIEKEPFMDEKMIYPLSDLPNANFWKFTMQLSTYAYLAEQAGYQVGLLNIEHIDRNSHLTLEVYPVLYMRDRVISMLDHYLKKLNA